MSPTELTLKALRKDGWMAEVVEKWIQAAKIRRDLFGFGDILAVKHVNRMVQACTDNTRAEHRDKLLAEPRLARWLCADGNEVELWSWGKHGERGKRKLWTVTVETFVLSNTEDWPIIVVPLRPEGGLSLF